MQQGFTMFLRESNPVFHNLQMALRNLAQHSRILHHAIHCREDMASHHFWLLVQIPLQHIGMHRSCTTRQAQVGNSSTIALHITRAVARTEHISILTNSRTDIALTELYQDIGLDGLQTTGKLLHQHIHSLRQALNIATGIVLCHRRVFTLETERVDKVQLKAIEIPFAQSLFVC